MVSGGGAAGRLCPSGGLRGGGAPGCVYGERRPSRRALGFGGKKKTLE